MEPYRERMADIIREEFNNQGLSINELPRKVQEALNNIEIRLANDLEFTAKHGGEIVD